jgi:hypothetical protein
MNDIAIIEVFRLFAAGEAKIACVCPGSLISPADSAIDGFTVVVAALSDPLRSWIGAEFSVLPGIGSVLEAKFGFPGGGAGSC